MIAVVVKGFATHRPGDLVDASDWRNAERQLRIRQLRAATASELALFETGVRNIHEKRDNAPKSKAKATAA